MNHQHRFHTLVSHVRGPLHPVTFGGLTVRSAIPVAVGEGGNQTVFFEVLSYAGTVAVTSIVDPDRFAELSQLTNELRRQLEQIIGALPEDH